MSTILITGATGFIGSHVARACVKRGDTVHVLVRDNSPAWRINDIKAGIILHTVDLSDEEKLKSVIAIIQPEIIYHFANVGVYSGVYSSDQLYQQVNLIGLINLLSALDNIPYKAFINVGSSSEYGPKNMPMKESDICEPLDAYGVSKVAATNYASMVGKTKQKPIATFRLFSPYGPYNDHRRLMSKVTLDLVAEQPLLLSNPQVMRDYIYIDDVTDFFLQIPDKIKDVSGEVFNLGSGLQKSVKEAVVELSGHFDSLLPITWQPVSFHPWESNMWQANMTKTFSTFSWHPQYSFEQGIEKNVEWFKTNTHLYT